MEKITTKEKLIEILKDVLVQERMARDAYQADENLFVNTRIKETIDGIRLDEIKHIAMLESLIAMLSTR